ncbi:MAG: TIGR04211 family SH3 domain-containing protein [Gammaproteobacteria bacterium]
MKAFPLCFASLLLLAAFPGAAETLYITGQIKAGLHQDNTADSPIVKLVPTGTAVDVIKHDDDVSFVREPGGASGWINNSYLVAQTSDLQAQAKVAALQKQLDQARQQIQDLQAAPAQAGDDQDLRKENADLSKQLKAEKHKVETMHAQATKLHKQAGLNQTNKSLYQKIMELSKKNRQLQADLARASDSAGKADAAAAGPSTVHGYRLVLYLILALAVGLVLGMYLLDILNRRRHGGFRV